MPRTDSITPSRRIAMQATLCCVLFAAVGAAALVDGHLTRTLMPQLGGEQSAGPLRFRLPVGWLVQPTMDRDVAVAVVDPALRSAVGPRRTLVIYRRRVAHPMSPAAYLQASGILEDIFGSATLLPQQVVPITLAGAPAILVHGQTEATTEAGTVTESDLVLCCVFPNRQAVTLWLAKLDTLTPADQSLFAEVAKSIRMDDAAPPAN